MEITLTKRQMQVLEWLAEGKTAWEIGRILNIHEITVRGHIKKLHQRLNVGSSVHAVSEAFRLGLIKPNLELSEKTYVYIDSTFREIYRIIDRERHKNPSSIFSLQEKRIRYLSVQVIDSATELADLLKFTNDGDAIAPKMNDVEKAALIAALEALAGLLKSDGVHVAALEGVSHTIGDISKDASKSATTEILKDGLSLLAKTLKDFILSGLPSI